MRVANAGPAATGVRVSDPLPSGLSLVAARPGAGSWDAESGVWSVGSMAPGAAATLELEVVAEEGSGGSTLTNVARVLALEVQEDPNPANNRAEATVRVTREVDVSVRKQVDRAEAAEGETVTFTVRVANAGPAAATGVVVRESLPAGLTLVSADASRGRWSGTERRWSLGDLAAEAEATLTVVARVEDGTVGERLTNVARYLGTTGVTDRNARNDRGSASVTVKEAEPAVDLDVTKEALSPTVTAGGVATFLITVTNQGSANATGVEVEDAIPSGLSFYEDVPSQGSYDSRAGVWQVGTLGPGASATLELMTFVDSGTEGLTITNRAAVRAVDQPDADASNDAGSASVTVDGQVQPISYTTGGNTQLAAGGFPAPGTPTVVDAANIFDPTPPLTAVNAGTFFSENGGTVTLAAPSGLRPHITEGNENFATVELEEDTKVVGFDLSHTFGLNPVISAEDFDLGATVIDNVSLLAGSPAGIEVLIATGSIDLTNIDIDVIGEGFRVAGGDPDVTYDGSITSRDLSRSMSMAVRPASL